MDNLRRPLDQTAPGLDLNSPTESLARPTSGEAQAVHKPAFILFLLLYGVNGLILALRIELPEDARWPEGLLLLATTATLLIGLSRRLPLQNVVMSTALIVAISGTVLGLSSLTGIPFGPRHFSAALGGQCFGLVPWAAPFIWIAAMVSSRGVARLIMRPWRKTNFYGFWVIGLTMALVLILEIGLEPYATQARHYWFWRTRESVLHWYGTPWVNFLGWAVTVLGILVLTTPWLINKQPVKQPTDYHPLIVWLLLGVYFAAGNALRGFWPAAAAGLAPGLLAVFLAIRGGRW